MFSIKSNKTLQYCSCGWNDVTSLHPFLKIFTTHIDPNTLTFRWTVARAHRFLKWGWRKFQHDQDSNITIVGTDSKFKIVSNVESKFTISFKGNSMAVLFHQCFNQSSFCNSSLSSFVHLESPGLHYSSSERLHCTLKRSLVLLLSSS